MLDSSRAGLQAARRFEKGTKLEKCSTKESGSTGKQEQRNLR